MKESCIVGQLYTISFLVDNFQNVNQVFNNKTGSNFDITENLISYTFSYNSTPDANPDIGIQFKKGTSTLIKAAKLELGSTQTLAHKENGVWVLNEIPDFGEQLRRCRDYCRKIKYATYTGYAMGVAMSANFVRIPIFFEDMRTTPTVDLSSASGLFLTGAEGDVYGVTFTLVWSAPNCIVVDATKTGAFISGQNYFLRNDATSFILASADL